MQVTMMGQVGRPTSQCLVYLLSALPCVSLRYPALPCLGLLCLSFSILYKEIMQISYYY